MEKHTPLPWMAVGNTPRIRAAKDAYVIGEMSSDNPEGWANAAFIVRAVNEYDSLKRKAKVNEELLDALKAVQNALSDGMLQAANGAGLVVDQVNQAIAKAEPSR